uniref:DUF4806 domain-containing protein n=1 Tax=Anopheles christyi TaxID=43041 RepID=A0A182JS24_9DIPT
MPYVLVKRTKSIMGRKEVTVAPDSWINRDEKGKTYVFMPNAVCPESISLLLENESIPTAEWEKHECEILCTNISSLNMAYTIIEQMQKQSMLLGATPPVKPTPPVKALPTKPYNKEAPNNGKQKPLEVNKRISLVSQNADLDYDPFADIPTSPVPDKRPVASSPIEGLQMTVEECEPTDPMQQLFSCVRLKQEEETEQDPFRGLEPPPKQSQPSTTFEQMQPIGNVEKFFSCINKEMNKQHDMLGDISLVQLFELLYELKCMMKNNQDELRRNINEGFHMLQKTVLSAVCKGASDDSVTDTADKSAAFEMKPVTCKEEMDELENRLKDETYRDKVLRWIDVTVATETNPESRMMNMLDKLIDRTFFTHLVCDPEERHQKIRLETYRNFCQLFEHAGTTKDHRADNRNCRTMASSESSNFPNLRMPYILVEMTNPIGGKELLAAPATWIHNKAAEGTAYLCWPYARSIRKLNSLFEDEYSIPAEVWEKHECEILCQNIPSLTLADKMIETMESSQCETNGTVGVKQNVSQVTRNDPPPLRPMQSKSMSNAGVQKLLSTLTAQTDDDPLGDVKPCPQMLDLMYELKSLIELNQEELRKKLKEGFGKVEKSVQSMNEKYLESNAVQYELGRADANAYQQIDQPEQFKVDVLTEMEALEEFEKRLEEEEYRIKVCQWIDASVGHLRESEHRMHIFLDLIIDRKLFAGFSWTGGGKDKRPMNVHRNILSLFEYAGTTSVYRADHVSVENFMRKKLHNSGTRVKSKGVRKSVPHRRSAVRQKRTYREIEESFRIIPKRINVVPTTSVQNPDAAVADTREEKAQAQSTPSSSVPITVRVPTNPVSSECVVIKQDTIFIEGMNEYEEMWDYRRLQK